MATRQRPRTHSEVIRCNNCGEDYSVTYKRCPFCDEASTRNGRSRGGKRLNNNTRGGGYGDWGPMRVVTTILSIALIIAAVFIVVTIVKPLIDRGGEEPGTAITAAPASDTPTPTAESTQETTPDVTAEPSFEPTPAALTAQSFKLNASDFTLRSAGETYRIRNTFSPSGTTAEITWISSNPASVQVAQDGTVTALANGQSTVTATMTGGYSQTCVVRCGWSESNTAPDTAPAASADLAINRTDITMSRAGETFTLKVTGSSNTPSWTSNDSSVATVSATGKVTAVKHGTATIKATVGGQTVKCIVRCQF